MKKILLFLLVLIILALSLSAPVFAHPGKTDANGGHYDHETGEYHYHHGYPAHQHYGGSCPYDFDDQTGINSRPSTGSSSQSSSSSSSSSRSSKDLTTAFICSVVIMGAIFGGVFLWFKLSDIFYSRR